MRGALLGLAALAAVAIPAVPAAADPGPAASLTVESGVSVHRGFDRGHGDFGRDHRGFRHHRRRGRGNDGTVFVYDRDWQGDSAWLANSYNDWWHERPERSFPRWMANNDNCRRLWWSGGGWRC